MTRGGAPSRARHVTLAVALLLVAPSASGPGPALADDGDARPLALGVRAELIAGALATRTDGRDDRRFTLERAELTAEADVSQRAHGEVTIEAVRSADPDSAAGIDGNSILVRVKRASVGLAATPTANLDIAGEVGLIADPWLAALGDFPLRTLGVAVVEEAGLIASSDLGATAELRYREVVTLRLALTNGEGAHQVERNQGKDTSVVLEVRPPLDRRLGRLDVLLYARDGSLGVASARDHRAGAAVVWHHPRAAAGFDVVRAWGAGGRADLTAWALEAWGDARLVGALGVGLRWDRVDLAASDGDADPGDRARFTGGLWYERAGVRLIAGYRRERTGPGAPIAGVPAATDADRLFVLVQGSFATTP